MGLTWQALEPHLNSSGMEPHFLGLLSTFFAVLNSLFNIYSAARFLSRPRFLSASQSPRYTSFPLPNINQHRSSYPLPNIDQHRSSYPLPNINHISLSLSATQPPRYTSFPFPTPIDIVLPTQSRSTTSSSFRHSTFTSISTTRRPFWALSLWSRPVAR